MISDAREGLKQAIATVLTGTTWQRCRVHFMRNLLATVPQGAPEPIAATARTIDAHRDHATAIAQLRKVADGLRTRFARTAAVLEEAAEDVHSRWPRDRVLAGRGMRERELIVRIDPLGTHAEPAFAE